MTRRAGRRIRSKTARTMLSFRHYEFKKRLKWKAWQRGAVVLDVNEAYTSKTCSSAGRERGVHQQDLQLGWQYQVQPGWC